jgi:hypothetical protein
MAVLALRVAAHRSAVWKTAISRRLINMANLILVWYPKLDFGSNLFRP